MLDVKWSRYCQTLSVGVVLDGCGRGREINALVGTVLRIEAIHGGMRPTKTLQNLIEVRVVDSPDSRSYGQKRSYCGCGR